MGRQRAFKREDVMGFDAILRHAAVLAVVSISASCATSKVVGDNVKRAVNGQSLDTSGLSQAVASDTKNMEANLAVLRRKMAEAYAQLRSNVQKHWGQNDAKVADRTVYVKYTQGYKSRVVTDFDHGSLTVETLEEKDSKGSLRSAIVSALLTTSDPATVDLFTDKDVALESDRKPYLYGLVHDNQGKAVHTRAQAEAFANYLIAQKTQTRPVSADEGAKTALFVRIAMVKNYEAKGAEHYRTTAEKYAAQYHVSPSLVLAIMRTESNFNPFAVSSAPAYGLMQLVPTSAGRAAVKRIQGIDETPTPDYLFDPEHNVELGAAYLSVLSDTEFRAVDNQNSREYCMIAAYNTGPRNVTRVFANNKTEALNDINQLEPPVLFDRLRTNLPYEETRQYVVKVAEYRKLFVGAPAAPPTAMQ
jgi:membrane-bound lytic murein transglycosylase C